MLKPALDLNQAEGLLKFEPELKYVDHEFSAKLVTESVHFKNELLTVEGTFIIFYCEGRRLIVLLFLCLYKDFGSSFGMLDFS